MPNFLKNSYTIHSIIYFQPKKDQNFKEGLEESLKYKAFNSLGYVVIACGVWDEAPIENEDEKGMLSSHLQV